MAELNQSAASPRRKGAVRLMKKRSIKVDLTPMVDLGFLLITFFVITTTMSSHKAMHLYLPADGGGIETAESVTLTIIPLGSGNLFYYHGDLEWALQIGQFGTSNFSYAGGIGNIIRQKELALDHSSRFSRKDMMLIIKPTAEASFQNITHALDEVLINNLNHYAFTDLAENEKRILIKLQLH